MGALHALASVASHWNPELRKWKRGEIEGRMVGPASGPGSGSVPDNTNS